MTPDAPLISIITPSLNAGSTLAETLESVVAQGTQKIEHLLIDACSSDATLKIAARHPYLTVISEKDRGIYDGMNKGARLAAGEWLLFLQADDWLPEGTLEAFRQGIRNHPGADILCGGAEAVKKLGDQWNSVWSVKEEPLQRLTIENIALGEPMINARLFHRDCFLKLGGFSLEYSLASDRDFLLHAIAAGVRQEEIPAMTYRYRWHADSSTMTEGNVLTKRLSSENLAIAQKHLSLVAGHRRKVLKRWHSSLTVQSAMNALESPGRQGFLSSMKLGCKTDALWPFRLSAEIARSLPGFLLRGGKTRSGVMCEKTKGKPLR